MFCNFKITFTFFNSVFITIILYFFIFRNIPFHEPGFTNAQNRTYITTKITTKTKAKKIQTKTKKEKNLS